MKKIILITTMALFFTGISFAQDAGKAKPAGAKTAAATATKTPEERAKTDVGELNTRVGLQPEQTDKITKLYLDFYTQKSNLMQQPGSMSAQQINDKVHDMKQKLNADLKSILTPEQNQKLLSNRVAQPAKYVAPAAPAEKK